MKKFKLCADDYGLNSPVNEAIIELIQLKRLTATSCLVNLLNWKESALLLKPLINQVEVGLHFNLTFGKPVTPLSQKSFGSLKKLILFSHLHLLNQKAIEQEFEAQLDAFTKELGIIPKFIDGHQHIHQLPIIREAMLAVYKKRVLDVKPYIRVSSNPFPKTFSKIIKHPKSIILALTGGESLRRKLKKVDIPYNKTFSGVYNFSKANQYAKIFPKFLEEIDEDGLIMCHPGKQSNDRSDPIREARFYEYKYLKNIVKKLQG